MSTKANIVGVLGERQLLVPELVHQALEANTRAKYFFTLLQLARSHADTADAHAPDLRREREIAGIPDARLDAVIDGSRCGRDDEYRVPQAKSIVEHVFSDIDAMMTPLRAAAPARFDATMIAAFERRFAALSEYCTPRAEGSISTDALTALTSSDRSRGDSAHLLVVDLHKAVDVLEASLATDDIEGAKTYGLDPADRPLVAAFMKGVHATEAAKLGHPGLATMATRSGSKLILENDIGETSAHVLVVHVEGLRVVVTNTDVHLPRLEFFRRLLEGFPVQWADLKSRSARELPGVDIFYEYVGTLDARDREELAAFLTHLGSRLVFLIDWNRARKALRAFASKATTLALLDGAAREGAGHRGFLEMGGERLVFDAMASVIRTPLRFGERLDDVLGDEATAAFLRFVLVTCSAGILAGRSRSRIQAEIRTELARVVRAGGERLLGPVAEHASLVAKIARAVREQLLAVSGGPAVDQQSSAHAAKELEHRADDLVVLLRSMVARMPGADVYRRIVELADDAADALEEAAFLLSLLPAHLPVAFRSAPLAELGDLVLSTGEAYVACVMAARRPVLDGPHEMLDAVDAVDELERRMDEAERRATGWLASEPTIDGRLFVLASRVSSQVERAVDALTHAALILRDRATTSSG